MSVSSCKSGMRNRPTGCSAAVAGADMMVAVMTGKGTTGRGASAEAAVIKSNGCFSF